MASRNYSRRGFLKGLGLFCIGVPFLKVYAIDNKGEIQNDTLDSELFNDYLKNFPTVSLNNSVGMDVGSEVFIVPCSVVHPGANEAGMVIKVINRNGTIFLETIVIKIVNKRNNSYYIIDKKAEYPTNNRLHKGTILLDNVKDSLVNLSDFNKKQLESRFIYSKEVLKWQKQK